MKRMLANKKLWAAAAVILSLLIVIVGYAVGMRGGILVAFSLGSILSAMLGVGLMGLIIYSNRSGHDEDVSNTTEHGG